MGKEDIQRYYRDILYKFAMDRDTVKISLLIKQENINFDLSLTCLLYTHPGLDLEGLSILLGFDDDMQKYAKGPAHSFTKYSLLGELLNLGYMDRVKQILQRGANINTQDKEGKTVLMQRVLDRLPYHDGKIEDYFDVGCNPNIQDNMGMTALMYISQRYTSSREEVITALLKYGANLDIQDMFGQTALMHAAIHEKSNMSMLIEGGASPFIKRRDGLTASDIVALNPIKLFFINNKLKRGSR